MPPMTPNHLGLVVGAVFGPVYVLVSAHELSSPVGPVLQVLGGVGLGLAAAVASGATLATVAGADPGALSLAGSSSGAVGPGGDPAP
jgi:hypothetical protein